MTAKTHVFLHRSADDSFKTRFFLSVFTFVEFGTERKKVFLGFDCEVGMLCISSIQDNISVLGSVYTDKL